MSFFVQATAAYRPKSKHVQTASLMLASVFILMVVAQLFMFEDFPDVIARMGLPGGEGVSGLRAALIVTLEVASVPFLLSMRLSPLARVVSMVAGWMVVAAWTVASFLTYGAGVNSGLFGATIPLDSTWWTMIFCLVTIALIGWIAWGMWPGRNDKR